MYVFVCVCTLARVRSGVQSNTQLEDHASCLLEKSKSNPIFIFATRCENIYKLHAMFPIVVVVVIGTVKIIKNKLS